MKPLAFALAIACAIPGPALAEPMPAEWWTALKEWATKVEKEVLALEGEAARAERFAAAWNERGDFEARMQLLHLTPRLRGRAMESFLIARLGDEPNAAIRRTLVRYMGELGAEAYRAPLERACKEDPTTFDFEGGCIASQGDARKAACEALEHLEEHMGDHVPPPGGEREGGWMGDGAAADGAGPE